MRREDFPDSLQATLRTEQPEAAYGGLILHRLPVAPKSIHYMGRRAGAKMEIPDNVALGLRG